MDFKFGVGKEGNAFLGEGWQEPSDDGVAMEGFHSEVRLLRPITNDDFTLSLEISPASYEDVGVPQRLAVVTNGEILYHDRLAQRERIDLSVKAGRSDALRGLALTMLHPDARSCASASHPLDSNLHSFVLHHLSVIPARRLRFNSVRAGYRSALQVHFGNQVEVQQNAILKQLLTYHNTIVYLDPNNELRHGPISRVPSNVFLVGDGDFVYFVHRQSDASFRLLAVPPQSATLLSAAEPSPSFVPAWRMEIVASGGDSFGLKQAGLLLCAEDTGRMSLSRERLGLWERFVLVQHS